MSWDPTRPVATRAARTMRDRVLREEPICRAPGCGERATQDDHIIGWSQREAHGMTVRQWHARSNHQGLCADHHAQKTATEAAAHRLSPVRKASRHPGLTA